MNASIVITTKDRKEDLEKAIKSSLDQNGEIEILVISDGSTDGTTRMVEEKFPTVRLISHEESKGLIVRRNEGASLAKGEIIVSIDDDAEFSSPSVVEQALCDFNRDPRIGAIAIPYIEPKKGNELLQNSPNDSVWVTDRFIGTSHAVRKDLFLSLGGYKSELVHQGEESDLSVRMLQKQHYVSLGTGDHVIHHESPKRDFSRMDYYGARNQILWAWSNVPMVFLAFQIAGTALQTIRFARTLDRPHMQYEGLIAGLKEIIYNFPRQPVSVATYRTFRKLRKAPQLIDTISNARGR